MEYQNFVLKNGIRIIHKKVDSYVAHCGFIVNTGSRDEDEAESGIAHFIEHVIFKGTKNRKAFHILSRLENVGGDLNAYTSKEETCIYASFLNEYYGRTLELFADIIKNSTYPVKELEKEKDVIIDEINSYKDSPYDEVFDEFEELLFNNHPLGRNILGTHENVRRISRKDIINFIKNNYRTDQMVICSVGKIDFKKLVQYCEKYFGSIKENLTVKKRTKFENYNVVKKIEEKDIFQTHTVIGNVAYSYKDKKKSGLALLSNILGGPGMNSRLNLAIREKHGLSYNIESNYIPYADTGVFNVYLGTDNGSLNRTINLVHKEINKLREQKLGTLQLTRAKKQYTGQIAISIESNLNELLSIGKSYLVYNKVDSIKEIYCKIEKLTSNDLFEIANEILNPDQLSTLIYKAKKVH